MPTELKPVAWIHHNPKSDEFRVHRMPLPRGADEFGWTETPLYTRADASAGLVEALEECRAVIGEIPAPRSQITWVKMLKAMTKADEALARVKGDA